ncbi:semaphorin-1A isoform X2 [Planococcus citri]|uniref:semaphorin-1A isoform X2 n=1 Tax=Planococcus citri TaxID=170843 RepID=UPI0031F96814
MSSSLLAVYFFVLFVCTLHQGQTAWQDNELAKISVVLGNHNVHRFVGNTTHTDYFKLVVRDGNSLLIAGRNAIYNVSATDLSLHQVLEWYSEQDPINMCILKGKNEENCQNYIRIVARTVSGRLLVCGTNSFKPLCREYAIQVGSYTNMLEKSGQAICPYDPRHNSTFIYVDNELYAGTVADFAGTDPIIYREPLQTEQYDSMSLNAPNFVNALTLGDFVYFFFRETAVEYINCGKAVFSRVARVCKHDRGGPHRFRNRWTSFLKSRLNCSVSGEFPFYFNEIQSTSDWIVGNYSGHEAHLVYGVFTTPANSITGSAICAFSLQDVSDTFEGNFKEQSELNSNWLPVMSSKVPDPRPGQCVNDSRTLPDLTLNFIKMHSLMDEAVPSYFKQPLFIRTAADHRFTHITVDPQIKTVGNKAYDVIFVGTDTGKVVKMVNAAAADSRDTVAPVVIEELQIFATNVSVRNLKIVRPDISKDGRLIVVSDNEVLSIPLHRCNDSRITSCSECVALQDPYCAWDKTVGSCRSVTPFKGPDEKFFFQNIANGVHQACPASKILDKHASNLGGLSSNLKTASTSNSGRRSNNFQNVGGGGETDDVIVTEDNGGRYSINIWLLAIITGTLAALVAGFVAGFVCGRKCQKDDDDNIPYPDTEYEYFEQRQNVNVRRLQEPKLLPQEEVTYAEPVLVTPSSKTLNSSPKGTLRKQDNNLFSQFQNGENYYPTSAAHPANRPRDHFGTLRSQRDFARNDNGSGSLGYRDGFGTTRSVKKVYL